MTHTKLYPGVRGFSVCSLERFRASKNIHKMPSILTYQELFMCKVVLAKLGFSMMIHIYPAISLIWPWSGPVVTG